MTDNLFEPLKEEKSTNINENVFADDTIEFSKNLCIDLEGKSKRTYTVKQLAYSTEMKNELEQFKEQRNNQIDGKK